MTAGMTTSDGFKTFRAKTGCERRIVEYRSDMPFHLVPIVCHQEIVAYSEKVFTVLPRGRDERDPASESFEGADRGDSGKSLYIGSAGNVHGELVLGEHGRHIEVRDGAAVGDRGTGELTNCRLGITNAKDLSAQPQIPHRMDEVLAKFIRAFFVAPVSDPYHVASLLGCGVRITYTHVSSFMPHTYLTTPALAIV